MFGRRIHPFSISGTPPCHECDYITSVLPWPMLEAANRGDVEKIKEYIDGDNDVNATYEGDSMLSRACADGHVEIVNLLLQCPDIHLNRANQDMTPLTLTARHGHLECMKLLLDSTLNCELKVDNCWKALLKFLATQPDLKFRSAVRILYSAGFNCQWEVVNSMLETSHQFTKNDFEHFITIAANHQRWDVVRGILKRDIIRKDELLCRVLPIAIRTRHWESVEEILHIVSEEYKLNIPTAELVLSGKMNHIKNLVKCQNKQETNAILLVAAAGGTSESIARYLLSFKDVYTPGTLKNALLMVASRDSFEMFPHLLSHEDSSYSFQDLHSVRNNLIHGNSNQPSVLKYFEDYLAKHQDQETGSLRPHLVNDD